MVISGFRHNPICMRLCLSFDEMGDDLQRKRLVKLQAVFPLRVGIDLPSNDRRMKPFRGPIGTFELQ